MSIFVGQLDRTLELLKKVGESANGQNEPGTLVYTICQDPQDEHKITIWEEYQDEAAAAHHRKQKEFIALASESKNLLDGALDIKVLRKARL